jgi:N-acetylglutamate synthase-like GNAT family acetyltransferase
VLAEMAGTTVGFAGIGPSRDPVESDVGELDTIAVSPGFWRRGIGAGLMVTANRGLDDGYAYAVLWTWTGYQAAYHFYPTVGWRLTSVTRAEGRQVMFRRPSHPAGICDA